MSTQRCKFNPVDAGRELLLCGGEEADGNIERFDGNIMRVLNIQVPDTGPTLCYLHLDVPFLISRTHFSKVKLRVDDQEESIAPKTLSETFSPTPPSVVQLKVTYIEVCSFSMMRATILLPE